MAAVMVGAQSRPQVMDKWSLLQKLLVEMVRQTSSLQTTVDKRGQIRAAHHLSQVVVINGVH